MKKQMNGLLNKGMWCAIVLFALRCFISIKEIQDGISIYSLWGFAGEAIGGAALLMVAYEKCLWKFDPFVEIPNINGSYIGTLTSNYDNKARHVTMKIKQSLLSTEITVKTEESISRSVSAYVEEVFGETELIYTYLNEPESKSRDRSEIHYGTATFILNEKDHLVGKYFTDRNTSGDMVFRKQK